MSKSAASAIIGLIAAVIVALVIFVPKSKETRPL